MKTLTLTAAQFKAHFESSAYSSVRMTAAMRRRIFAADIFRAGRYICAKPAPSAGVPMHVIRDETVQSNVVNCYAHGELQCVVTIQGPK